MLPARRRALAVLGVLAALPLAACSAGAPSVLVADESVERLPSPRASAELDDPAATTLAAPSGQLPEARPTVGDGVLIEGLGLLSSAQHDVAFGTVVNPTGAAVRVTVDVTTYDDAGVVLSQDNTAEVEVPAADSTLFVAEVITPAGATVARMDAAHSVVSPVSASAGPTAPSPALTVKGRTIHPDPLNPTVTGRVSSAHPGALEAVRVMAVCTADGEPVAAGFGRVPKVPAHGDAAYEVMLYGATPDTCEVTATR
ncbi:hypothetical protein [Georgenia thermotolerans]|uniref:Uncharacterized protein n=1 Tax=Georgenia thermotolerans TaxID=527326 RepID=A0A7J5UPP1_9MICO|nr:hypothetical protein [Georgenia thermotolerans]KAE8764382.1 hypothetical protein GB883_09180 [Georgenia thermotolerans]